MNKKHFQYFIINIRSTSLLVFVWVTFYCTSLSGLEYGIFAKSKSSHPIKKIFVISERCSGSNYINNLILENFQVIDERIGHKHYPPWYELPPIFYKGNPQYYTFEKTENFLFIIIFRNPYDWVRSLHLQPFHAHRSLIGVTFSDFIRTPWKLDQDEKSVIRQSSINQFLDLDYDGQPFKNVLELRTAKIKNMLLIKRKAKNVYYINYETVRDHPKEVVEEIGHLFPIVANATYTPVESYKGKGVEEYKPKKYEKLSKEDLRYINENLDRKLEKKIGYQLIKNINDID